MKDKKKAADKQNQDIEAEVPDVPADPEMQDQAVADTPSEQLSEAETRKDIRVVTELESMVHGFDDDDEPWKEYTTILNLSKSGAGFTLTRPCVVGRLVKLTTAMPAELRAFDHTEKLYTVVGLIQYCNRMENAEEGELYNIGVAFAGKDFPESYFDNPAQSYRISGSDDRGTWTVAEAEAEFTKRRHARFRAHLDVTVSLIKKDRGSARQREDTVTHDISTNGACVVCSLPVEVGERVKFASKEHNFYAIAIVRNRAYRNNRPTLHLEFVESSYPVKKIPHFSIDEAMEPERA